MEYKSVRSNGLHLFIDVIGVIFIIAGFILKEYVTMFILAIIAFFVGSLIGKK